LSAYFKAYDKSKKQISRSYHGNPNLLGQKRPKFIIRSKLIVGSNFFCNTVCFYMFCCNSVIIMGLLQFPT